MKIDILGVQAFIAVAEHANFQKAAASLNISQTALTRRLQNLEAYLGVALVERTTRSVALTDIGRDFLPQTKRLLADLATALAEIKDTGKAQRGNVCMACIPTAGIRLLPGIIREYSSLYPNNRIRILDQLSPAVAQSLLRREAEFGISLLDSDHPDFVSIPLLEDTFALLCRDDHELSRKRSVSWHQLQAFPLILSSEVTANRSLLNSAFEEREFEIQPFYETRRSSTAIALVVEGVAAAVVPKLAIQKGVHTRIKVKKLVDPVISRTVVLTKRKSATLSPAAQALYDLIRKRAVQNFKHGTSLCKL